MAERLHRDLQLIGGIEGEIAAGHGCPGIFEQPQRGIVVGELGVRSIALGGRPGAAILLQGEVGNFLVRSQDDMAPDIGAVGLALRPHQFQRPEILEAAAQPGDTLAELRAIRAARHSLVRMGVHVENAAVGGHIIDDPDMTIDVIDCGAGMDRAGLDLGRVEILDHRPIGLRVHAVGGRPDLIVNLVQRHVGGNAAACIHQIMAGERAIGGGAEADVRAPPLDLVHIRKWQTVFPGIIGPQHIDPFGAVGMEDQRSGIAIAVGIAGPTHALDRCGAAAFGDLADKVAEAFFISGRPFHLGNVPGQRLGTRGQEHHARIIRAPRNISRSKCR